MGSNQPYDPFEENKKQRLKQAEEDRQESHRRAMKFYDEVGSRVQSPLPSPAPPKPERSEPVIAGLMTPVETKGESAGFFVVVGCIIAAVVGHMKYGVNSGSDYAVLVGVTAVAIWIAYALRELIGFAIKMAIGIGVVLFLIGLFAHK